MSMAEWRRPVRGTPNPHSDPGVSVCRIFGIIFAVLTLLFGLGTRAAFAQSYDTYFVSGPLGELQPYIFDGSGGFMPYFGSLAYDASTNSYYGTTYYGGAGHGTIFKFDAGTK